MFNSEKHLFRLAVNFIMIIFFATAAAFAQEPKKNDTASEGKTENLQEFMEEGMKEIDYYSLEELLNVEVEVASLFAEDELVVGSTVTSISSDKWKKLGARRLKDAFSNELSVVTYDHIAGSFLTAIRGYTSSGLAGIAYMIDGVPINSFIDGKISYLPDFGLGTLDRIELIKGPGSAIYGSDAFHGVISMKTFESDKNYYSIEGAGAYPLYGDASVKISHGLAGDLLRVNFAASTSGQTPLEQEYEYRINPPADPSTTATREYGYKSNTGVLKLAINPADRIKIKLGSYVWYGQFNDYPGIVKNFNPAILGFEYLDKYDTSGQETLFLMENASAAYTFPNKISVEAGAHFQKQYQSSEMSMDKYDSKDFGENVDSRTGADLIIKQPDNPINLQWLIAYSFTYMKVDKSTVQRENWNPALGMITLYGEPGNRGEAVNQQFFDKDRTINSAYTQTKWGAIKNSLYVILGGRLDNYSDYGNQLTPRGGLIFLPTEKSSVKALYGRAFRASSGSELYGVNGLLRPNNDLEPETIDVYELIFMYKEKKWKASLNGFYSKWKNGMTQKVDVLLMIQGKPPVQTVNEGKNDAYGGEFSLFYTLDPVAFDIGFSYVISKAYDVARPNPGTGATEIYDEEEYVAFPKYTASTGIYYTLKPYNINFYLNNRILYKMKETHYNMSPGTSNSSLPLYWRMDLYINKMITEKAEAALVINNLLNRKNYLPSIMGEKGGNEEPGISVMLKAGYRL